MSEKNTVKDIARLVGANMDIDFTDSKNISWKQDTCPWNKAEDTKEHKCATKNVSICKYFCGIEPPDVVLCNYKK